MFSQVESPVFENRLVSESPTWPKVKVHCHFELLSYPWGCVCVCVRACCKWEHTPIHKQLPEMPPSALFTFCILSGALIQKPEPCKWPTTWDCGESYHHVPQLYLLLLLLYSSLFPTARKDSLFYSSVFFPLLFCLFPLPGWREWPQNARCITEWATAM